jgi:hypothetical protein
MWCTYRKLVLITAYSGIQNDVEHKNKTKKAKQNPAFWNPGMDKKFHINHRHNALG